jgi:hypothetical protein
MVNTKMFEFKHPKYYTELRKLRNKEARRVQGCLPTNELHNSDQAISLKAHDGECERAPDPGLKQQASSTKPQAPSIKPQAPQAASHKHQAPSSKRQA